MKKLIATVLALLLALTAFTTSASAISAQPVDGLYYMEEEIVLLSDPQAAESVAGSRAAQTVSGSKHNHFYNANGVKLWTVTVTGTFSYDGSSATCTSVSKSYTIYDSAWKVTDESCSKSGNKAMASFTVKRYVLLIPVQTENVSLTLTCSANGTLS